MKKFIRHFGNQMDGGGGGGGGGAGGGSGGDGGIGSGNGNGNDDDNDNNNNNDKCGMPHKKCTKPSHDSWCPKKKNHKGKHICRVCGKEF
jgi:hypothetical protein